ncbi:MAG: MFS transporter [Pseudomonadota bacterium]
MSSPLPSQRRTILAGLVGNVMEWYDFAVYGYFATVIGNQFFPLDDPTASLLAAFAAFAVGFLVRPLGGLVFGRIGDLVGRKRALTLSVLAMAMPTVLIALLPTYATIGIAAPIAIVALRIVQGLSVGGEYTNSIIFLVERSSADRRAFTAVWGVWGATAGVLLGSGIGALATTIFEDEQLASWGWRLPFLLGALVAVTGIIIRNGIEGDESIGETQTPVRDTFGRHRLAVLRVALLNIGNGVGFYAVFVYAVTYIQDIDKLSEEIALNLNTGAMSLLLLILPIGAWLSDRFGRKPLLVVGGVLMTFGAVPLFMLIHSTNPATIFLGEAGFVLAFGLFAGGIAAANVELMPSSVRCTGLAFAYNASIGYFGGTTPLIVAWLIAATGNPLMPAYWLVAASAVSLFSAVFLIRETRFSPLR